MALFSQSTPEVSPVDPYDAFIGCPNRSMELQKGMGKTFDLRCPKYSDGAVVQVEFTSKTDVNRTATQLGCGGCPYKDQAVGGEQTSLQIDSLHPEIATMAGSLFGNEHYPEAVLNGWQTVRAELRARSGHERASDAFGNGGVDVASDVPEHLREDVEQGAKFLMMAIDRFRNVGAHSPGGMNSLFPDEPASQVSMEFLSIASIAMRILDRNRSQQQ